MGSRDRPLAMPYVVYWNNLPAPYMVERFNVLVRRGNLDFEAWFSSRTQADRSWEVNESQWQFKYRYLPAIQLGNRKFYFPTPLLAHRVPDLLVSLYAQPSFVAGLILARLRGTRTAIWAQVTMDTWIKRSAWKDFVKRRIFSKVDASFGSGEQSRAFAMRYGMSPERAMILRHAVDVPLFQSGCQAVLPDRELLRGKLGLRGVTFIFVGRLWWGKGLAYLLEAFNMLCRDAQVEASLLLVGDGPEEEKLKAYCDQHSLNNVVFAGFRQKHELPALYSVSDALVFPTLGDPYGLVVDEAMACSLPVISTDMAGEIRDRVENGVNGYVVPAADSGALFLTMKTFASNSAHRALMGGQSLSKISTRTHEHWAEDFERMVGEILTMPPRGEATANG